MELPLPKGLIAGFSKRDGGVSPEPYESLNLGFHVGDEADRVLRNRMRLAKMIGFPLEQWACSQQVHGSNIRRVTRHDAGKGAKKLEGAIPETDGLYTREAEVLLTLGYADCVPLYFFAPGHDIVGIAHAGWRGTTADIAGKMIDQWIRVEKIPRADIHVVAGPAIDACCYEVDRHVIDEITRVLGPDSSAVYHQINNEHYRLNLKECNRKLCEKAGIPGDHIECSSYCTGCRRDLFYSHRLENGSTGRMLGWIGMCNREANTQ